MNLHDPILIPTMYHEGTPEQNVAVLNFRFYVNVWTLRAPFLFGLAIVRWCAKVCTIEPDSVPLPLKLTLANGDEIETECSTTVLWPWDFFNWLWTHGKFFQWVADEGIASDKVENYWQHCQHLDSSTDWNSPPMR